MGRQVLQVDRGCRASTLKTKIRDLLNLEEEFKINKDNGMGRPSPNEIRLAGTSTLTTLGIKSGDTLHVKPMAGTRFQEEDEEISNDHNGPTNSLANGSEQTPGGEKGKISEGKAAVFCFAITLMWQNWTLFLNHLYVYVPLYYMSAQKVS